MSSRAPVGAWRSRDIIAVHGIASAYGLATTSIPDIGCPNIEFNLAISDNRKNSLIFGLSDIKKAPKKRLGKIQSAFFI
ncbi:hypothetical protein KJ590_03210 [Patescibacteria group bacterium]|nr:hypothetical protein [Patescibacteria group bacterium]